MEEFILKYQYLQYSRNYIFCSCWNILYVYSKRCKGYIVLKIYFREEANKIFWGVCEVREDIFPMLESWRCLWIKCRQGLRREKKRGTSDVVKFQDQEARGEGEGHCFSWDWRERGGQGGDLEPKQGKVQDVRADGFFDFFQIENRMQITLESEKTSWYSDEGKEPWSTFKAGGRCFIFCLLPNVLSWLLRN